MHEVLVNRLGGLSLPRKSVVRLTDRPDMTLDVYRGRKTTKQQTTTSTNNVLGSSGAYSHKIDQKLSLHKHILLMPTSVYKLHKNLLAIYPQFPTLHPVF